MKIIRIADLSGPVCVAPAKGEALGSEILRVWSESDAVTLDFSGVVTLTSSFLNPALSQLHASFPAEVIDRRLVWAGLDPIDAALVQLVLEKSAAFHSASDETREMILAVAARAIAD